MIITITYIRRNDEIGNVERVGQNVRESPLPLLPQKITVKPDTIGTNTADAN